MGTTSHYDRRHKDFTSKHTKLLEQRLKGGGTANKGGSDKVPYVWAIPIAKWQALMHARLRTHARTRTAHDTGEAERSCGSTIRDIHTTYDNRYESAHTHIPFCATTAERSRGSTTRDTCTYNSRHHTARTHSPTQQHAQENEQTHILIHPCIHTSTCIAYNTATTQPQDHDLR